MKTFVMGDIHGAHKALLQCLKRSGFNRENDTLIQLGDVADGWSEVYECVDELLSIKNLISIKGNHDDWFLSWLKNHSHPSSWQQGGIGTLTSYCSYADRNFIEGLAGYTTDLLPEDISVDHINFFKNQLLYYKDEQNNVFVHAGFDRHHDFELTEKLEPFIFYWDRDLWGAALSYKDAGYPFKIKEPAKEIFIGHTTTRIWKTDKPMHAANIWNLDTGAGWGNGKLTIMDIHTKEYWQSDSVDTLYPNERGRG